MKNKLIRLLVIAVALLSIPACSNNSKNTNSEVSNGKNTLADDVCEGTNEITVTILKEIEKKMFEYSTENFEVKSFQYNWLNDSTANLKLSNYLKNELVAERKDDQIDINITFYAKQGEKLETEYYGYQKWKEAHHCKVTLTTSKGNVYFNWSNGMPHQGGISIDNISEKYVCGSFNINVDSQKAKFIGTVKLNGKFACKK